MIRAEHQSERCKTLLGLLLAPLIGFPVIEGTCKGHVAGPMHSSCEQVGSCCGPTLPEGEMCRLRVLSRKAPLAPYLGKYQARQMIAMATTTLMGA